MASVRIRADQLGPTIQKILDDYGDEIERNVDEITLKIGRKGATALKNESLDTFPKGTGKYAKGWTASQVKAPHYTSVVIHNKTPGLPHLLEHGHVLKRGGRQVGFVEGREHIARVEETLSTEYELLVVEAIKS